MRLVRRLLLSEDPTNAHWASLAADKLLGKPVIQPIFISCDPARDTLPQVTSYIRDFHPRMLGLTGTYDQVKRACKSYRVYFSTPPDAKAEDDYLVDHRCVSPSVW